MGGDILLRMTGIGKSFSGVPVLSGVDFDLRAGEVHILAGENGAGKSTLIKIITGVYGGYEGGMEVFGKPARFASPQEAGRRGVSVIHQEMSLIPGMNVVDNIFLGREKRRIGWRIDRRAQIARIRELLDRLDLRGLDLRRPVEEFPMTVRQRIEIAKALAFDVRILVMDEPTSALPESEVERLFDIIAALKASGVGIVYISHKMEEIYRIADRITVLRNGESMGTAPASEMPEQELVRRMVGRALDGRFPPRAATVAPDNVRFRVKDFSVRDPAVEGRFLAHNVSFEVHAGEIVGLAGLQGSGNTELLNGLFGTYGARAGGEVWIDGVRMAARPRPGASIRRGLSLLTNDRKASGIVPEASVADNITLAMLARSGDFRRRPRREREAAARQRQALSIRLRSLRQAIATLSGGNQQKALLGRWLETQPSVLLLDEPTRGVDVGAKFEIYDLMNRLTGSGMAILLITSELPELLAMSDRVLVMHRGEISGAFPRGSATQENILHAAMGA